MKTNDERLHQFILDYGSHYIQSIKYGYKLAIYGSYSSKDETEIQSFGAAFKATFTGGGAGGKVSDAHKRILTGHKVELRSEVTAGDTAPRQSVTLNGFLEIYPFLEKVKNGDIKLFPGPVEATAITYWHTLLKYPKTREILAESQGQVPDAPFGVPSGTVTAWSPPRSAVRTHPDGSVEIIPPNGWALCDGTRSTPDLRDRFIMGTTDRTELGIPGGAPTHMHNGTTDINVHPHELFIVQKTQESYFANKTGHNHTFHTSASSHIPPFVKLLYIMKE